MRFRTFLFSLSIIGIIFVLPACGTKMSSFSYSESAQLNEINKSDDCYDASILLGTNLYRAKEISEKVIIAIDASIQNETATFIQAQRNRHIGLFVGSGGEQLFFTLQDIDDSHTFVTVATKTGFVGGAGQKAWSCKIVDEMAKMAARNNGS